MRFLFMVLSLVSIWVELFAQNGIAILKSRYNQWNGLGIVICQKENLADTTYLDLRNSFIYSSTASGNITTHATSVATIMAGRGLTSVLNEGVAPRAKIVATNFETFFAEPDAFYTRYGVSVVNHSYGGDIDNRYSQEAASYDAQVQRLPYLLHLFSSGNSGYLDASSGSYQKLSGWANLTGSFKASKNSLVIGAHDEMGNMLPNSSHGPTYDGRIKPELVAYSPSGTSFAVALTSGVVAILQQYMKAKMQKLPSTSLIKATLIASSTDLYAPGPDYISGFGALNASAALQALEKNQFLEASIEAHTKLVFSMTVPANVQELKVALAWTDPPASVNASKALVNNLDITLSDNQQTWFPWVLSTKAQEDSLKKNATKGIDNLNNIELITANNPKAGTYKIEVSSSAIEGTKQSFSIAYSYAFKDSFTWQYPTATSWIQANKVQVIKWQSNINDDKGILAYSIDEGKSWQIIDTAVNISNQQYEWKTPNIVGKVLLRLKSTNEIWQTESFQLYFPLIEQAINYCGDSLSLSWQYPLDVSNYIVQRLQWPSLIWETLSNTTQSSVTLQRINPTDWLTVIPVLLNGSIGLRSVAFSIENAPVPCYLYEWNAEMINNQTQIDISLTQTKGVQAIQIEKQTPFGWQVVQVLDIMSSTTIYQWIDSNTLIGLNNYRISVRFSVGSTITSNEKSVFRLAENELAVFYPNPVPLNGELQLALNYDGQLWIYDLLGKVMLSTPLFMPQMRVSMQGLPRGTYICKVIDSVNQVYYKKIIIR